MIITWIYKKTRFSGEQVKWITRTKGRKHKGPGQVDETNIQEGTIQVNK